MPSFINRFTLAFLLLFFRLQAADVSSETPSDLPPATWIDKDTGHRIWRLSDEPNSSGLYFNINAYTADKKSVIYTAPDGFHAIDLASKKSRLILPRKGLDLKSTVIVVGNKTSSVYFTRHESDLDPEDSKHKLDSICKVDANTGKVTKLAIIPAGHIYSINADETLGVGTYEDGPPAAGSNYDPNGWKPALDANGKPIHGPLVQSANKGEQMKLRLDARIPMVLFTLDLKNGKVTSLLHTTDWLGHLLFSPSDPSVLMYCHEGHWDKVDRIWFIHTDGTGNTLMHKRRMIGEVAGHEFWGIDGKSIWYDLQTPGSTVYWLAGYNTETHQCTWYHMDSNDRSLHFNVTQDESLFCGDGSDPKGNRFPEVAWIKLFYPELRKNDGAIETPELIRPGKFRMEHLVNMSKHDYRLEPNVRFTPDKKMILFTGNMFGPSYVFGVEVAKAAPDSATPQH